MMAQLSVLITKAAWIFLVLTSTLPCKAMLIFLKSCSLYIGMITYWPLMERCAAIAKKELNYVGPFGLVAGLCGTIYIRRNKPNDSHSTMNHAAELVKQKKVDLLSFIYK